MVKRATFSIQYFSPIEPGLLQGDLGDLFSNLK